MRIDYNEVQEKLLQKVNDKSDKKLVDVLSEVLNISDDSSYRRIRKEKILTLDEILLLCTKFNISFDETIGDAKNNIVAFSFNFKDSNYDFQEYLTTVIQQLNRIKKENGTMYYSAKDIPVFHFFQSKELTAFKVYYWLKTMSNNKTDLTKKKFDFDIIPAEIQSVTKQIYTSYSQVKSHEIWNYETIHSTINQITYYKDLCYITSEQAIILFNKLEELLKHLQEEIETEYKYHIGNKSVGTEPNFKFYYNEIIAADNSIYAEYGKIKESFKPHIVLNYMTTNNIQYCDYIKSIFESVIQKSTLISGVNEKDRKIFFNYNFKKISRAKQKIELELEEEY
jgi:hypothetical protein